MGCRVDGNVLDRWLNCLLGDMENAAVIDNSAYSNGVYR